MVRNSVDDDNGYLITYRGNLMIIDMSRRQKDNQNVPAQPRQDAPANEPNIQQLAENAQPTGPKIVKNGRLY